MYNVIGKSMKNILDVFSPLKMSSKLFIVSHIKNALGARTLRRLHLSTPKRHREH